MSESHSVSIRFPDETPRERSRHAGDLLEILRRDTPEAVLTREQDDPAAMDFGATLVIVLGTPAVVALAHAVGKYMLRSNAARLEIRKSDGTSLVVTRAESADIPAAIEKFMRSS